MVVGTPYQREMGTLEWEDPKRETNKWSSPALGQEDGDQATGNLAVLGTGRCIGFVG